jgi:hypothetical protein
MIKDFCHTAGTLASTLEQRLLVPSLTHQQRWYRIFDRSEWKNSTLPDIHHQLIQALLRTCQAADQILALKIISTKILQLEMRPDTWRKLQFDHISFFSTINWYNRKHMHKLWIVALNLFFFSISPTCAQAFCLQCGESSHQNVSCEENMHHLISQYEMNDDIAQTLKWKIENSQTCPSCCIMINRDEGCNKVDCTLCGFSFCWECKSSWSEVTDI